MNPGKDFWQFIALPEALLAHGDTVSFTVGGWQSAPKAAVVTVELLKLDSEDGEWTPSTFGYWDKRTFPKHARGEMVVAKQYSVTFSDADGKPINGNISMKGKTEAVVRYQASGNNPSLSLLTQGGLSASPSKLENGDPCFVVKTDYGFSAATAKIVAVFTFPEDVSPVTIVKTFTVSKE